MSAQETLIRAGSGVAAGFLLLGIILWAPVWLWALVVVAIGWQLWREWLGLHPQSQVFLTTPILWGLGIAAAALGAIGLGVLMVWVGMALMVLRGIDAFEGEESAFGLLAPYLLAAVALVLPMVALAWLPQAPGGSGALILLLVIIWGADSAAYFVGRAVGRTKVAPEVSPGKSWEGVVGGALAAMVLAGIGCGILDLPLSSSHAALLGLMLAPISVLGDLWESAWKRLAGVKDSGAILPGHGGMLDRMDALLFAAIPYTLLYLWFVALAE
ncbi:MAG: phosphatidate cytidylyltransferase [Alphaproteobacteria bacterium CG_4_10_14_0_2_um_filter_63_37]|nr:MAG: hypothetical protein AUJ55_06250 [Proteobacteria bacterium CG1_02_64_396]PJA23785.1 MAG: phosphatidate cytidylyltransferase [Alphaproteobacteria bacterium CG_4_10_14_0_2_um_filter_63_37]